MRPASRETADERRPREKPVLIPSVLAWFQTHNRSPVIGIVVRKISARLLARTLPFGNVLWPHASWYDETRLLPALRARRRFGLGREKVDWFTPSDERPEWLKVSPADLLVGGYVRPDGDVLLTLGNISDQAVSAQIGRKALNRKFPPAATSAKGFRVWDALVDQEYNYHDSGVMIPANSLRVLWVGNNYPAAAGASTQ